MNLRKIPLESLINLLADLFDGGANYIDISSEENDDDNAPDIMKITVKPEYLADDDEGIIEIDLPEGMGLTDNDIDDLI